jgi:hypothetical protein
MSIHIPTPFEHHIHFSLFALFPYLEEGKGLQVVEWTRGGGDDVSKIEKCHDVWFTPVLRFLSKIEKCHEVWFTTVLRFLLSRCNARAHFLVWYKEQYTQTPIWEISSPFLWKAELTQFNSFHHKHRIGTNSFHLVGKNKHKNGTNTFQLNGTMTLHFTWAQCRHLDLNCSSHMHICAGGTEVTHSSP